MTGLSSNILYYFRVGGINWNNVVNYITIGSTRTTAGGAPTNSVISAVYVTTITATWGTVPNTTGYDVEASSTNFNGQTGWALLGLLAAGEAASPEVAAGVEYLLQTQTLQGRWEEPYFTGTGFPGHFMIRYHLYRDCFPLQALGEYLQTVAQQEHG